MTTMILHPPCTLYAREPLRYYESSIRDDNPTMMKYEIDRIDGDTWTGVCWMTTKANPAWHKPAITERGPLQELMDEVEAGHLICADFRL